MHFPRKIKGGRLFLFLYLFQGCTSLLISRFIQNAKLLFRFQHCQSIADYAIFLNAMTRIVSSPSLIDPMYSIALVPNWGTVYEKVFRGEI